MKHQYRSWRDTFDNFLENLVIPLKTTSLIVYSVVLAATGLGLGYVLNEFHGNDTSEATLRNRQLEAQLGQLRQINQKLEGELQQLRTHIYGSQQDAHLENTAIEPASVLPDQNTTAGGVLRGDRNPSAQQMSNLKTLLRENIDASGMRSYADLFEKLGFTDDQREEFLKLWTQSQSELLERGMSQNEPSPDSDHRESDAAASKLGALKEQHEQQLQELLGSDYPTYKAYSETLRERATLKQFAASLQAPLDDYSKEEIIRIMSEENKAAGSNQNSDYTSATLAAMEERDARIVGRAGAYLTQEQRDSLERSLDRKRSMMELAIEVLGNTNALAKENE